MKAIGDAARARILLVDDHAFMRVAMGAILGKDEILEVVGEARDGEEAVARCRELRPDLILMEVSMPKMDGIEATRRIKAKFPETGVLVLTSHDDPGLLMEAVMAGAAGYVLKGDRPDRVLESVRAVLLGDSPLDQGLAMRLLRHLGQVGAAQSARSPAARATAEPAPDMLSALTPRETEVLVCLASGKTNRQIAKELNLSLSTVKRHLEHILSKPKVSDRTLAAVKAVAMGLLGPTQPDELVSPSIP
jgi:DNA-binding NarL/FixJ family response regulator